MNSLLEVKFPGPLAAVNRQWRNIAYLSREAMVEHILITLECKDEHTYIVL